MWNRYLFKLGGIADNESKRDQFNANFTHLTLCSGPEVIESGTIGPIRKGRLHTTISKAGKGEDELWYAIVSPNRVHLIFNDYTCLRVTGTSPPLEYHYSSNGKLSYVRVQHAYYTDVGQAVSHSKRPFNDSKTLTLLQMIDRLK